MAKDLHMRQEQDIIQARMQVQQTGYRKDIDRWYNAGSGGLQLTGNEAPVYHEQSIISDRGKFVDDLTSLGNEPYLKVLTVFLGAGASAKVVG